MESTPRSIVRPVWIPALVLGGVLVACPRPAVAQNNGVEHRVTALEQKINVQTEQLDLLMQLLDALSQQLDVQSQKISALEPLDLTVNCDESETVANALKTADSRLAHVTVRITGNCTESVRIQRDNTSLLGSSADATLTGPEGKPVLSIAAEDVTISGLTLAGGTGVKVGAGSSVRFFDSHLAGSTFHGLMISGASVEMSNSSVKGSNVVGIQAMSGSTLRLLSTLVEDNTFSVGIEDGSFGLIDGGSEIRLNGGGVSVGFGSMLQFGQAFVTDNRGMGLMATGGSVVHFGLAGGVTTINGNAGFGLYLTDTSVASSRFLGGHVEITANSGWGVFCSSPPAVSQIVGSLGHVSGNTPGDIHSGCRISG